MDLSSPFLSEGAEDVTLAYSHSPVPYLFSSLTFPLAFYYSRPSSAVLGLRPNLEKNNKVIILLLVTNQFYIIVNDIQPGLKILLAGFTYHRSETKSKSGRMIEQSILC